MPNPDRKERKANMDFKEIDFCPAMGGLDTAAVAKLLANGLFGGSVAARKLLTARYAQMKKNCGNVPHDDPRWDLDGISADRKDKAALLPVPRERMGDCGQLADQLWSHANYGHDMPTWMVCKGGKSARRVMVVSQDPLRTNHKAGSLVLSTPFGFHSADYRNVHCENKLLFCLMERLLEECGACVYLTDCRKLFTDDVLKGSRGKKNCVRSNQRLYRPMFRSVLEAEIAAFDPNLILTLGNDAAEYVGAELPQKGCRVQDVGGRKVIAAYHTGARASVLRKFANANSTTDYFGKVFTKVRGSL